MTNEELVAKLNKEHERFAVINGEAKIKRICGHYDRLIDEFEDMADLNSYVVCENCWLDAKLAKQQVEFNEKEDRLNALKLVPKVIIRAIRDKARELHELEMDANLNMGENFRYEDGTKHYFLVDAIYENDRRIDEYYNINEMNILEI